jgi:hypothetical protein
MAEADQRTGRTRKDPPFWTADIQIARFAC